jgi:ABC-2 type transport system permease protein
MRAFFILWRRELGALYTAPLAYAVTAFFLATMGLAFYFLSSLLAEGVPGVHLHNALFGTPFYWVALLVIIPLITMRTLAEERRAGTLEALLTAPISDAAVVAAKFAGLLTFFIALWLPTLLFLVLLSTLSDAAPPLDTGAIAAGYLGTLLFGAFFLSLGLLCSASTASQVVAGISCFAFMLALLFTSFTDHLAVPPIVRVLTQAIAPTRHLQDFARGIIDTRPVFLYLSGTFFFLFATVRTLEARQWK